MSILRSKSVTANNPPESVHSIIDEEADEKYVEQREALARVTAALAKEKDRTADLTAAAYRGARDAASSLVIAKLITPKRVTHKTRAEEVCVPLLGDLQLGKLTSSYNSDVCEERVALYATKVVELADMQRSIAPVNKCHIVMLGDMVEGETIFPGQHFLLDSSLFMQAMVNGPRICINFINQMLGFFEEVEVTMVDGNHGVEGGLRGGKHHPQTNSDRMMYYFIKTVFEQYPADVRNRIKFNLAADKHETEKNWYAIVHEGDWSALAIHGYEIKGNGPWHGLTLAKKVNGWASGAIDEYFLDVLMGHWHQCGMIPLNKRKVYVSGSTESDNDYARQGLGAQSEPKQWDLFVSPSKGRVTAQYDVHLR